MPRWADQAQGEMDRGKGVSGWSRPASQARLGTVTTPESHQRDDSKLMGTLRGLPVRRVEQRGRPVRQLVHACCVFIGQTFLLKCTACPTD